MSADVNDSGTSPKLPTWNGDWKSFTDYKLAVEFEADGCKPEDLPYLAPRLVRNLTHRAWESCAEVDREQLRKKEGYSYLLKFLQEKRGKQEVDLLGDALGKYFQSVDAHRRDGEALADFELRHSSLVRDMKKAMQDVGTTESIPSEIFGWFVLNRFIKLDASDIAGVKSMAKSYKLEDVMAAMRRMWGGDSLVDKDSERRRKSGATKTFLATSEPGDLMTEDGSAWANAEAPEEDEESFETIEESQAWFDESLEAFLEDPSNPEVHANFHEAKQRFYKDARKSLDQARTSRGFYPMNKGAGKSGGKTAGAGRGMPFRGKCMRCGKVGHKAADCRQSARASDSGSSGGSGVGFVFMTKPDATELQEKTVNPDAPELLEKTVNPDAVKTHNKFAKQHLQEFLCDTKDEGSETIHSANTETAWVVSTASDSGSLEQAFAVLKGTSERKAIIDSGASESIVGVNTLQQIYDHMEAMGFDADREVEVDRTLHKTSVFGNNQTSAAIGLARLGAGICGREQRLDVHVVEGSTPMLLSGKWLYDMGAVINFKTGRARFMELGGEEVQLERAPSYHLMLPMNAYKGNEEVLRNLFSEGAPDPGIAEMLNVSSCTEGGTPIPAAAEQS